MAKYRKKPIVIEAFQWRPLADDPAAKEVPHWLVMSNYDIGPGNCLMIHTLEGIIRADPDDWIIKGVKGELYPCKPDIFAATYEAIDALGDLPNISKEDGLKMRTGQATPGRLVPHHGSGPDNQ